MKMSIRMCKNIPAVASGVPRQVRALVRCSMSGPLACIIILIVKDVLSLLGLHAIHIKGDFNSLCKGPLETK